MMFVLGIVLFALAILISVALHECGHMWVARATGMKVRRYFVGFGPTLWSTRRGETEYGVKGVPLGGFCDIAGMTPVEELAPDEQDRAMYKQATWKRVATLFAGPGMNFVICLVLIYGIALVWGLPNLHPPTNAVVGETGCVAKEVAAGKLDKCEGPGPAAQAGIRARRRRRQGRGHPGVQLRGDGRRGPQTAGHRAGRRAARRQDDHHLRRGPAHPTLLSANGQGGQPAAATVGAIGVGAPRPVPTQYNAFTALPATFAFAGDLTVQVGKSLVAIPTKVGALVHAIGGGQRDPETPMSVVGASIIGGDTVDHGLWVAFWFFLAQLNLVLGAINLLPLLPFDGGHIAVAVFEKIRNMIRSARGKVAAAPVNYLKLMPATYVVLVFVVGYMAVDRDRRSGQPDQAVPVTSIGLGMPQPPAPTLAPRRTTRQLMVRDVGVGSDYPISVQSMCTTKTHDVNSTLQQIAELTAAGCDIVRVACPRQEDADALAEIAQHSGIPVIADIHFQPKYIFAAIDAGCAAVRVNPGNIKEFDGRVGEVAKAAGDAGIPIRIGVNAGSLDKRFMEKYGKATPEALVESALWEASLFEEHGFGDIKISVKHNDPVVMVAAYEQLAAQCDYPLHLGVTEAGPAFQGTIKSAVAFGALLSKGIGDTIRVSLSAPPVEEVKVGSQILESLNLRPRKLEIVSCPSCGRAQVDVYTLANEVSAGLDGLEVPLRVAVMGCVVNGPGEAREADLGVASGNGKGQIFVKGEVIKTVPEAQIVETLIEEALRLAEEMGTASGTPVVTVS